MNCYLNPFVIRIVTMHIFYAYFLYCCNSTDFKLITYVCMSIVLVHNINQSFRNTVPLNIRF